MMKSRSEQDYSKTIYHQDIGDIHGCFIELQEPLYKAGILDDDLIIALGDIVDCGPDSVHALNFFCNIPTRFSLMSNHERKHVCGAR